MLEPAAVAGLATAGVLFGPDCSQFQPNTDWPRVRTAGCLIGGYKVSEGFSYTDPSHAYNRAQVPAAGLVPLAYHYLVDTSTPESQADHYCGLVDPHAIHALDVEAASAGGLQVARWVRQYRTHYPQHGLVIYTNQAMWANRSHVKDRWPAGVGNWHAGVGNGYYTSATGSISAEYANTAALHDSNGQIGAPPARLWQITDHAAVPGVAGTCDGNAFLGTLAELRALATGTPGDDHMSAQDVADLKAYIAANVPTAREVAQAVHTQQLYADVWPRSDGTTEPLTFARAVRETLRSALAVAGATDTLEASEAAEAKVLAGLQADDAALQAGVDALNAKLGSGEGGQLTKADLLNALGAIRLTTEPAAPTA